MRADLQGAVSLLFGIVTLRLALSRLYLNFVRPTMRPWLVIAGSVLIVLGSIAFLRATRVRRGGHEEHAGHDHDHHHAPLAAWLLLLPVLTLFLVTPAPLGSFAAGRQSAVRVDAPEEFAALPAPKDGAIELKLNEFADRALYDTKGSLVEKQVRLVGFVTAAPSGSGPSFYLTRFVIACCAADARSVKIAIYGVPSPPLDSWTEITGRWRRPPGKIDPLTDEPALTAKQLTPIAQPDDPYES